MRLTEEQKQVLLSEQQNHVVEICAGIASQHALAEKKIAELEISMRRPPSPERAVEIKLHQHYVVTRNALSAVIGTPYFCRCDVVREGGVAETMYFGKQSFTERGVFSWVVPAAALRFADIGAASYAVVDGSRREVNVVRKDQYVIASQKLTFFATESTEATRTVVYQEHLTRRKSGFILPEIVEQMEKAQDDVVRAHWKGPLLIGGPAGSGKTTLALHRVAYLLQAPELAEKFPQDETIVFVHDGASKAYFGGLFPELGLSGVQITTFHEWAMSLLEVKAGFVFRFGADERERDQYELAKKEVLRKVLDTAWSKEDVWVRLEKVYSEMFDSVMMNVWRRQRVEKALDRFDIALLLHVQRRHEGRIAKDVSYYDMTRMGKLVTKVSRVGVSYRLAVVDEIQNWLPEELDIIHGCLDEETKAVMFVGDTRQKTRVGSVEELADVGMEIPVDRRVILEKVYRNTRQIVEYCVRRGYAVQVLPGLTEGPEVYEQEVRMWKGVIEKCVEEIAQVATGETLGVIAFSPEDVAALRKELPVRDGVHIMTAHEAQGLEFENVVCVEVVNQAQSNNQELQRIQRDLLYVTLTRAMRKLVVVKVLPE